jgi:hypothetical protein
MHAMKGCPPQDALFGGSSRLAMVSSSPLRSSLLSSAHGMAWHGNTIPYYSSASLKAPATYLSYLMDTRQTQQQHGQLGNNTDTNEAEASNDHPSIHLSTTAAHLPLPEARAHHHHQTQTPSNNAGLLKPLAPFHAWR